MRYIILGYYTIVDGKRNSTTFNKPIETRNVDAWRLTWEDNEKQEVFLLYKTING